jgi:hypothetical protein
MEAAIIALARRHVPATKPSLSEKVDNAGHHSQDSGNGGG